MKLYRAADDDTITDTASFAETLETAQVYLSNPGFGGRSLWVADVEPQGVLDLTTDDDPVQALAGVIGVRNPGAIGADEWVPRVADEIAAAGYEWVRVCESYPADTITWIWVGGDEPEMEEIEQRHTNTGEREMTTSDTIRRALANARQCDELAARLFADAEAVRDLYGPYLGGTESHPHVIAIQDAASHARQCARTIRTNVEQLPGYAEYTEQAMDDIGMNAVFGKE